MPGAVREASPVAIRVELPGGLWPPTAHDAGWPSLPVRELELRAVDVDDEVFVLDSAADALPCRRATELLARCLTEGDRLAEWLTVGDREALLLQLRRMTIGDELSCLLQCPVASCGEKLDLTLRVSELLVERYEDVSATYESRFDHDGAEYVLRYRLPAASDLAAAAALARTNPERAAATMVSRCVASAARNGEPMEASALPDAVREMLDDAMAARDPQAQIELDVRCPACRAAFSALFDTASFFLRELEDRATRLLSDVNALAAHYHWSEAEILHMPARRRAQYLELVAASRPRARSA